MYAKIQTYRDMKVILARPIDNPSKEDEEIYLDLETLYKLARPVIDRLTECVDALLRMPLVLKEIGAVSSHYTSSVDYNLPSKGLVDPVCASVTSFLRLALNPQRSWLAPRPKLEIDCWDVRNSGRYFKISLDEDEATSYLSLCGGVRYEELYAIKRFGVKASEFSTSVIANKIYPTLLWHCFVRRFLNADEEIFDLDYWETGLA